MRLETELTVIIQVAFLHGRERCLAASRGNNLYSRQTLNDDK